MEVKQEFESSLKDFTKELRTFISTDDGQWTIKGFIDKYQNIYSISSDTKIVSKILEIHLFPNILSFAKINGYKIELAKHQNYYPDLTLINIEDDSIKFAVDYKTTYRNPKNNLKCNGFTLGSRGTYFTDRSSSKNIQYPYGSYTGHYCLGIIYDRETDSTIGETKSYSLNELESISSVISNFQLFAIEKWKIASDKSGSGNTANIGSINNIDDIINGRGVFSKLGESWFDDYWMNYGKISISDNKGGTKTIKNLLDFVKYKDGDIELIVQKNNKSLDVNK